MRGLQIAVFAALFIYTACAAPSILKRTSLPTQGTPGSLQPRWPSWAPWKKGKTTGKSKPPQDANKQTVAQVNNKQTGPVPVAEHTSRKGQEEEDHTCCNCGPNTVQWAWNNKGQLISRKDAVNQVYMLKDKLTYKGEVAVIKAIPAYNDAIHDQVVDQVKNLILVEQFLAYGVKTDPERFAIDTAHVPSVPKHGPFKTYFIVMPYKGVPRHKLLNFADNAISLLKDEAIARYKTKYGMRRDNLEEEDFAYHVPQDRKTGKVLWGSTAAIVDWTHGIAVSEQAQTVKAKLKPEPVEFCSHEVPRTSKP